ncbi:MAG TPA: hypothetical protein VGF55_04280 [Gemmataceae bacterium]|jgi:hypothetical protein
MSVRVACPSCGEILAVEESLLGRPVMCGVCDTVFQPTPLPSAPPAYDFDRPDDHSGMALASLILGCVGLAAWCLPIFGLPVTITGLVLGIKGVGSRGRGQAIAGIVLNAIGLVLSVVNAAVGAYLGATGQHPLFQHH